MLSKVGLNGLVTTRAVVNPYLPIRSLLSLRPFRPRCKWELRGASRIHLLLSSQLVVRESTIDHRPSIDLVFHLPSKTPLASSSMLFYTLS